MPADAEQTHVPSGGEKMRSGVLIGLFGCSVAATVASFLAGRDDVPLNVGIACTIFTALVTGILLVQQFNPVWFSRMLVPSSVVTAVLIAAVMYFVPGDGRPAVPAWLPDTNLTSTGVTLAWGDDEDAAEYRLFRINPNGSTTTFEHLLTNRLVDTQLTPGAQYVYFLIAVADGGLESDRGSRRTVTTLELSPDVPAPGNLTARYVYATEVALTWAAPEGDVEQISYVVLRDGQPIGETAATEFSDTPETGLEDQHTYQYVVRAKDADGRESGDSDRLAVTTPSRCGVDCADVEAPDSVRAPKAKAAGPTAVALTWNGPVNESAARVTGYRIYRDGAQVAQVGPAETAWTDKQLTADTKYTYCIKAVNIAGAESVDCRAQSVRTSVMTVETCAPAAGAQAVAVAPAEVTAGTGFSVTGTDWRGTPGSQQIRVFLDEVELTPAFLLADCGFTKKVAVDSTGGLTGADGRPVAYPVPGQHTVRAVRINADGSDGESATATVTVVAGS